MTLVEPTVIYESVPLYPVLKQSLLSDSDVPAPTMRLSSVGGVISLYLPNTANDEISVPLDDAVKFNWLPAKIECLILKLFELLVFTKSLYPEIIEIHFCDLESTVITIKEEWKNVIKNYYNGDYDEK